MDAQQQITTSRVLVLYISFLYFYYGYPGEDVSLFFPLNVSFYFLYKYFGALQVVVHFTVDLPVSGVDR